jgi:hypothetical protein
VPNHAAGIIEPDRIKDWSFLLGADYFVVPIVDANTTLVTVKLPGGPSTSWFEYYEPSRVHTGGSTFFYATPLERFPVFVRVGALLPLHVSTPQGLIPHGDESYASALTLLWHLPPRLAAGADGQHASASCTVYEFQPLNGTVVSCELGSGMLRCSIAAYARDVIIILRGVVTSDIDGIQASATYGNVGGSAVKLRRLPPPTVHDPSFTPRALDWDGSGPSPVHPVHGLRERLAAAAAGRSRAWSLAGADESGVGVPELVVRMGGVPRGATLVVSGIL